MRANVGRSKAPAKHQRPEPEADGHRAGAQHLRVEDGHRHLREGAGGHGRDRPAAHADDPADEPEGGRPSREALGRGDLGEDLCLF